MKRIMWHGERRLKMSLEGRGVWKLVDDLVSMLAEQNQYRNRPRQKHSCNAVIIKKS